MGFLPKTKPLDPGQGGGSSRDYSWNAGEAGGEAGHHTLSESHSPPPVKKHSAKRFRVPLPSITPSRPVYAVDHTERAGLLSV